jgi:Spy/CpxP family protein refolding chaperone
MKRLLLISAVVIIAGVAALSFPVARWLMRHGAVHATTMHVQDTGWLKRELRLTDEQVREVGKLEAELRAKLEACCKSHCAARFGLGEEIAKPAPDAEAAKTCVERMNAAQADAERATLEHILKVRMLLNAEQARRYADILRRQVCGVCPLGLHSKPD